ncbi:MAG: thiol:disulfide interchange protein DsbA/DsbL [Pseudomonadales bacterium]|nr:thiol:disulfide interchange protein DsbA/DsbL [Pseudomonadales bacterium]
MNQQFREGRDEDFEELEKELSKISLVSPSEKYRQIPQTLQATANREIWYRRPWAAIPAMLAVAVTVGFIALDFNQSPDVQPELANEGSNDGTLVAAVADNENEQPYQEGTHYIALNPPIDVTDSLSTEVVAFFWYPCRPCASFEPFLSSWESELGDGIKLTRVPAIWSEEMRFHARVYYTAQELGLPTTTQEQFYAAFQNEESTIGTEEGLLEFFQRQGVAVSDFIDVYNADSTSALVDAAVLTNFAYQIESTPSLFVDGAYGISPQTAGGYPEMLEVADYVIDSVICDTPRRLVC